MTRPRRLVLFWLLGAVALGACAGATNLKDYDPAVDSGPQPTGPEFELVRVRGYTIEVYARRADGAAQGTGEKLSVSGELLAIDEKHLYMWDGETSSFLLTHIDRVKIFFREAHSGGHGAWTGLGALSTLTHGFFLIVTLPLWLMAGIPASLDASTADVVAHPDSFDELYRFARFPQGLPPNWPGRLPVPEPVPKDQPRKPNSLFP